MTNLAKDVRGSATPRARRRSLIYALASVPVVVFAVAAMVRRGVDAQQSAVIPTAAGIFISGTTVSLLLLIGAVAFAIALRTRLGRLRKRFALLASAFPEGIAFLVGYPAMHIGEGSPRPWQALNQSRIHAVVIGIDELLIVSIDDSVNVLARTHRKGMAAKLGTREVAKVEMSQIEIALRTSDLDMDLGVLPNGLTQFSVPSYSDFSALVELDQQA